MSHPYAREGNAQQQELLFSFLWRVCHSACSGFRGVLFYTIIVIIIIIQLPADLLYARRFTLSRR